MRKKVVVGLSLILMLSGCAASVSQEEYDSVKQQAEAVESEKAELEASLNTLKSEKEKSESEKAELVKTSTALESEKKQLESEYAKYKEDMKPYEELSVAEAKAKKAEAELQKAEAKKQKKEQEEAEAAAQAAAAAAKEAEAAAQAEAQAAAESEAAAAKAAEEAAGYDTGISYDQLARTPDDYVGKKVKFHGKVIQVLEEDGSTTIRLAVDSNYDTIILGTYDSSIVSSRVLDDDIITVMGVSGGLYSYKSTMGGPITIPSVLIEKIEQ